MGLVHPILINRKSNEINFRLQIILIGEKKGYKNLILVTKICIILEEKTFRKNWIFSQTLSLPRVQYFDGFRTASHF